MVAATQAVLLRDAVGEGDGPMGAFGPDQAERALEVAEEHQVFAEQAHRLYRLLLEVRCRGGYVPVAPQ